MTNLGVVKTSPLHLRREAIITLHLLRYRVPLTHVKLPHATIFLHEA